MKKLLLIRHAKATHESGFEDYERPLTHSGVRDAAVMAARIDSLSLVPQVIVSSPALRTLSTANIFSEHLSRPEPITDKAIYDASEKTLLKVINQLPDQYEFVALVGHNPGISQILYYLSGEPREMDTCGIALLVFQDDSWATITENVGKLVHFDSPKL
ncbi:phosphohistidine phosphatase SixA [Mucilaginibacter gynuensis]|uniref:Phosphohistidine phosphatase SixA n=1 Tax=Mucilaginibacter gynuensis TaxID=1302236 RepID=A0ABP8HJX9_9SPHI